MPSGGRSPRSQSDDRSLWRVRPARALDDISNQFDNESGIVELNPMTTRRRDDVSPARRQTGELPMPGDDIRWLIAARHDDERNVWQYVHATDSGGGLLQSAKTIRHLQKALRL